MSKILTTFRVRLNQKQKALIDREFSKACKAAGTDRAGMLGQPVTKMPGIPVIHMAYPYIEITVIPHEVISDIQVVLDKSKH